MGPERTRWALILAIWAAGLGAAGQYGKISIVFDRMGELFPGAGSWLGFTVSMVGVIGIVFGILAGAIVAAILIGYIAGSMESLASNGVGEHSPGGFGMGQGAVV